MRFFLITYSSKIVDHWRSEWYKSSFLVRMRRFFLTLYTIDIFMLSLFKFLHEKIIYKSYERARTLDVFFSKISIVYKVKKNWRIRTRKLLLSQPDWWPTSSRTSAILMSFSSLRAWKVGTLEWKGTQLK